MTITIYDGNNFARRRFEHDPTGLAPRNIMLDILKTNHPVIWVWDAIDGSRKRKDIFPGYKQNRGPLDRTIFDGFKTLEVVLKHTPAIQIKVPGFEADDVIASLVRHYCPQQDINLMSNDWDFAQLAGEFPNKVFGGWTVKEDVPPKLVKLYKLTVGDPADCIPGMYGFGVQSWRVTNKKQLKDFVSTVIHTGKVPEQNFLPKRVISQLDPEHLRSMAKVVSFFDVPMDLINANMTVGVANYGAADAYLKEFFQ